MSSSCGTSLYFIVLKEYSDTNLFLNPEMCALSFLFSVYLFSLSVLSILSSITAVGACLPWDRRISHDEGNHLIFLLPLSTPLPSCTAGPLLASRTKMHPFMRFPLDVINAWPKEGVWFLLPAAAWHTWEGDGRTALLNITKVRRAGTDWLHKCYPFKVSMRCSSFMCCTREELAGTTEYSTFVISLAQAFISSYKQLLISEIVGNKAIFILTVILHSQQIKTIIYFLCFLLTFFYPYWG